VLFEEIGILVEIEIIIMDTMGTNEGGIQMDHRNGIIIEDDAMMAVSLQQGTEQGVVLRTEIGMSHVRRREEEEVEKKKSTVLLRKRSGHREDHGVRQETDRDHLRRETMTEGNHALHSEMTATQKKSGGKGRRGSIDRDPIRQIPKREDVVKGVGHRGIVLEAVHVRDHRNDECECR